MQRSSLPPPRFTLAPAGGSDMAAIVGTARFPGAGERRTRALEVDRLPSPADARLLKPKRAWSDGAWRAAHHFLARRCFPRVPGIGVPYSRQLERQLVVSEATVSLPGLGDGLSGTTVLFVTDVHAGPFLAPPALERTFEKLISLAPDLVLLGGDLTTSGVDEFDRFAPAFRLLRAPLGVFAVMGNHEYYTRRPDTLRRRVEEHGIRFLDNRSVVLQRGGARLLLAGIDDLWEGRPDLDAALRDAGRHSGSEAAPPVVLLSHNPDVFFEAARRGAHLILSGHTHGGQIRIPGWPPLIRQSYYGLHAGRYATDGAELIVSRGLGADGLPIRIGCPPEAVLLRLV